MYVLTTNEIMASFSTLIILPEHQVIPSFILGKKGVARGRCAWNAWLGVHSPTTVHLTLNKLQILVLHRTDTRSLLWDQDGRETNNSAVFSLPKVEFFKGNCPAVMETFRKGNLVKSSFLRYSNPRCYFNR